MVSRGSHNANGGLDTEIDAWEKKHTLARDGQLLLQTVPLIFRVLHYRMWRHATARRNVVVVRLH